ncbi:MULTISPECIES: DUF4232 domain-containing protein [Streptomyces]|uniref:DUF4232 domain-containing protein n=3 Tax=Streptomyces rimosus TaxID=1927 RepID=A0A8A1UW40_STRR1|nr:MULTISPECIES: DUF4232 domain-containing protein [Streptomyces]KOG71592.1 hypothetical protein ADK78_23695 [Kitasatospora aureofaciens]MYT48186.1 DUF4232 domain-containing protein [Streptomyces sp. SID5471]KEF07951.1 hypothetical protein DF17_06580 [Streptomyces rimosus]KEF21082.1 hypothetical protein DF18_07705 [Streptomyces rimosus]KOT34407.1 hypothetical protein ADK84_24115 [Streptomyces sp. NRRL WC-3701]
MTARRSRHSASYAALAVAMAGALALTGCSGNSKSSKSSSKKSSSKKSSKSKTKKIIGGGAAAGAGAAAGSRGARACGPGMFRFEIYSHAPNDHVVIKAVNTSSTRSCLVYNHPLVRFNGAKDPLPLLKDSNVMGGDVETVRPKGTVWASIPTGTAAEKGSGKKTYATVEFSGSDLNGSPKGPPQRVDFRNAPVAVGASQVTYWQSTLNRAESYTKPKG